MNLSDLFTFPFKKKSLLEAGVLRGMTDYHSHLLPGVDDGVRTEEEFLAALRFMRDIGVKKVLLTPHVMENYPENNRDSLRKRLDCVSKGIDGDLPEVVLAAEYMLDSSFTNHLKDGLLTFEGNNVLLETSYMAPPIDMRGMIFDVMANGYSVVLAHPERYSYMDEEDYLSLAENNVVFQLNLMSLSGFYGAAPYKKALFLLERGLYGFAGSDCHNVAAYDKALHAIKLPAKHMKLLGSLING